jgi:MEMO1 family protein
MDIVFINYGFIKYFMNWYPSNKKELHKLITSFINPNKVKNVNGIIVPHAGYEFSGSVAAKAYSYIKGFDSAIIFGPSHYEYFKGIKCIKTAKTPMGDLEIIKNNFDKIDYEHSIQNQLPFLKFMGIKKVLPLVVGDVNKIEAKKIALNFKNFKGLFVFSTDLSHFMNYNNAKKIDNDSINKIIKLDSNKINACGINALKIFFELAKIKKFNPKLIEYKNSGDIILDKSSVVGYASFIF